VPEEDAGPTLFRVTATSNDRVVVVVHRDGRERDERIKAKEYVRLNGTTLAREGVQKVVVTHLGEIRRVND
jgi:hypothetical protein